MTPPHSCLHFSIASPAQELPDLLRRVADEIERLESPMILDVAVSIHFDGLVEECEATVYYDYLDAPHGAE